MDKKQSVFAQELTGLGECRKDRQEGLQEGTRKLESELDGDRCVAGIFVRKTYQTVPFKYEQWMDWHKVRHI